MNWLFISGLGAAAVALDVASKVWARNALNDGSVELAPFLALQLAFNPGVSFSLLSSAGPLLLSALSALLIAGLVWLAARTKLKLERIGFALVIGGAMGNLVDRLGDGTVTDFILLHAAGWHFPTFNLADVAISAGVLFVLGVTMQDAARRSD